MKLAHVTIYPPKGKKHVSGSGVASYSKNLVSHLSQNDQTVICDIVNGRQEYDENGISVRRVFERNSSFIIKVHQELKNVNPDVIHIQQELSLFGNVITAYLLQWLVLFWRKKTVVTLHGVVDPILIDRTFVAENNSRLPVWLVRSAFYILYKPLMRWANKLIVHEQIFKDIAVNSYGIDSEKIHVIPHGIESLDAPSTADARAGLQLSAEAQVVLFMGYATGYKGIDLLIEGFAEFAKNNPKAYLIIGSGPHPKLKEEPTYQAEYARLQAKAKSLLPAKQYAWEGFLKEAEIPAYYGASDLSLYPYTTSLSSSGPMSLAIGYEKPFLVSTAFASVFRQYDQLLFEKTPAALAGKLTYFFAHRERYAAVSRELKQSRNWARVGDQTARIYSDNDEKGVYETEKSASAG